MKSNIRPFYHRVYTNTNIPNCASLKTAIHSIPSAIQDQNAKKTETTTSEMKNELIFFLFVTKLKSRKKRYEYFAKLVDTLL